jgi:hypothetical protein
VEKLPTKCTPSFISLFYANSFLHVSTLLGHPQADSLVHCITAVDGCPIAAGFLVVHTASNMETREKICKRILKIYKKVKMNLRMVR